MIAKAAGYLMTMVATAMLVAGVQSLLGSPRMKRIATLAGGSLLLLTVLTPLVTIAPEQLSLPNLVPESVSVEEMKTEAENQLHSIIKQRTEAYILDKAGQMGVMISADVEVADSEMGGVPYAVTVTGLISNAQRDELSTCICSDLNIPPERQRWKTI